ncbi:MAG TPA: FtsX-like permease family protein [Solirubrobacteraceae bacterium]|nr:FtsX-like permease family protein [Solirubrobacteraceae bacterium]
MSHRRLQTIVIGVVVLVSTAATVVALALVAVSNAPFDHAFAVQRGAEVSATVDATKATAAQLDATARLSGVTATAGPFPEVTVTPKTGAGPLQQITLSGRANPGGPVDDVTLVSGRWATRAGEVVLDDGPNEPDLPLGGQMAFAGLPGKPGLTVVGIASSVTNTADGWVSAAEVAALRAASLGSSSQMLYRFRSAGSASAVRADVAALARALPSGAIVGTESYLAVKTQETDHIAPFVPFLIAFGLMGILMAVLIVANVVSGAVVSGYRRIGILKSIGFTPGQVAGAYAGQVMVPTVAGCAVGVVLGNLVAAPLLANTATVYGVGALAVPTWVNAAVPGSICVLAGITALAPALRAGRLSAVQAIANGRAPRTGRGFRALRLLGRLPLARPVAIGLAAPFARPARTALTLAAVVLGATAVTFAIGLTSSLTMVVNGLSRDAAQPVHVELPGGGFSPPLTSGTGSQSQPSSRAVQRTVETALHGQPGTLRFVAEADDVVRVSGLAEQVPVTVFRGNSAWTGYDLLSGRWLSGTGQVEAPTGFLNATGKSVGDTVTFFLGAHQIRARIVGEIFDNSNRGISIVTNWRTVATADSGLSPDQYDVGLRAGTNDDSYTHALAQALGPNYNVNLNQRGSGEVDAMIALISTLTVLLALVAGLGVLNTVVLYTRDRVHDLGVFKAVGMAPRQVVAMVLCSVAGIGLVGGLLAVPVGVGLHHYILPAMASTVGLVLPSSFIDVYHAPALIALATAGMFIAMAGALLPATWAAQTKTASALRTE